MGQKLLDEIAAEQMKGWALMVWSAQRCIKFQIPMKATLPRCPLSLTWLSCDSFRTAGATIGDTSALNVVHIHHSFLIEDDELIPVCRRHVPHSQHRGSAASIARNEECNWNIS
jgi:hypothetical protein